MLQLSFACRQKSKRALEQHKTLNEFKNSEKYKNKIRPKVIILISDQRKAPFLFSEYYTEFAPFSKKWT